jgi:AraC family transcriptional activator of mtrCDE
MDTISHLLDLARVRASLDKRCLLAGATAMDVAAYEGTEAAFHFLLEGECTLHVAGRSIPLVAGDAVLLPSSPPHTIRTAGAGAGRRVTETQDARLGIIRTEGDETSVIDLFCGRYSFGSASGALLLRSLPDPLLASFGDSDAVRSMATLMRQEALAEGPGTNAILSSISTALLAMLLRQSPSDLTRAALWTAVDDPRIAAVIDSVLRDPGGSWSLQKLAAIATMSRATFLRRFARQTGTTVGVFLTTIRLMTAADLLTEGELTVAAIAAKVGYRSESAFGQAFAHAVGTTPGRFRREGR